MDHNTKGRKYFFECFCNSVIACMDKDAGKDSEEQIRFAFKKIEQIFEDSNEINWWNWFGNLVNTRVYNSLFSEEDSDNDLDEEKQENIYEPLTDEYIERKVLDDVKKSCNINTFTWKVQYNQWVLENKTKDTYIREGIQGKLRRKQNQLEKLIDKIEENDESILKNIFANINNKRIEWRFSAIDGDEFYKGLAEMEDPFKQFPYEKIKIYENCCTTKEWMKKCDSLYNILENVANMESDKTEVRYGYYKQIETVLCSLVPVTYLKKTDGGKEVDLKPYERWKQEVDTIHKMISDKRNCIGIGGNKIFEIDIISKELEAISKCTENQDEMRFYESKYIEHMEGETKRFDNKIRQVHDWVEKENVSDIAEIQQIYNHINL